MGGRWRRGGVNLLSREGRKSGIGEAGNRLWGKCGSVEALIC